MSETPFPVLVGPIHGELTLASGTVYDVTPEIVYVQSQEEALELADLVGQYYAANGHPNVEGDFDYVPTEE